MKSLTIPHLDRPIRSKLFVPGSRPELFPKAFLSAADALSFDLEDAVVPAKKERARADIAAYLSTVDRPRDKVIIVRVNNLASEYFLGDVTALAGKGIDVINLPKAESADDILRAIEAITAAEKSAGCTNPVGILANIETPKGLRLAYEIASAHPRVIGLQLGFTDFSLACGISSQNKTALNAVRLGIRFAAAEAGIPSYDGAFTDVKNSDAYRLDACEARDLGFAGKSCIHPSQIAIANEVFSPTVDEIARAESLLVAATTATQSGVGAFLHEGKMVDIPIIRRAQGIIDLAAKLGLIQHSQGA